MSFTRSLQGGTRKTMKVKIFNYSSTEEMERQINCWLESNNVKVLIMTQSESQSSHEYSINSYSYTVSFLYELVEKK